MISYDADKGFEHFTEITSSFFKGLPKNGSRAIMIEPIFLNCLQWEKSEIQKSESNEFINYIFSLDGTRRFLLETKKVGETLVPEQFTGRYYKICGILWDVTKLKEAIEHAQRCCVNAGVNYGVVSNGYQYIIFEAFKRGSDWREGNCIIFHSLADIKDNFTFFWNTLSKNSVNYGSLRRYISQENSEVQFLFRPIDRLHAKYTPITRNNLSPILTPIADYFFSDIIDERQIDILKNCYVSRSQYREPVSELNQHFDIVPEFARKYNVEDIIENTPLSSKSIYAKLEETAKATAPINPLILLMGGIGSGKTTFIHHYFSVVKPPNTLWFYVNFFDVSEDTTKIEEYVLKIIVEEFNRKYRDTFATDLELLKIQSLAPNVKEIRGLFSLLRLRGYAVALILDNVDQHSYINAKYQEQALLVGKRLTDSLGTITILSLREENFFKSALTGVLDSFPAQIFHISSPNLENLIRMRIDYVIQMLQSNDKDSFRIIKNEAALGASKEIAITFFQIIGNSLRSSRRVGREILEFIKEISGGDMRTALSFFRVFLVSGNTDVDEMLAINEMRLEHGDPEGYVIPFHHVVKSIILEHSRLYQMSHSRIMNLFDFNSACGNSHFTYLRLLNYLYNRLSNRPAQGRGFVEINNVVDEADSVGISRTTIDDAIVNLAKYGLVQFENQSKKGYEYATYIRVTNTGIYYLKYLSNKFIYLDLVWMDTPMTDYKIVNELVKLVVETKPQKTPQDIETRFKRTELFIQYLENSEKNELNNHCEYRDSDFTRAEFMPEIRQAFEKEKQYIQSKRRIG
jgi:hypothetical protein